jgi:hypothetical protein
MFTIALQLAVPLANDDMKMNCTLEQRLNRLMQRFRQRHEIRCERALLDCFVQLTRKY